MIGFGLSGGFSLTARCVLMYLTILSGTSIDAVSSPLPDEATEAEAAQIKAAERFLIVLEKNPRRGTALDRVYGHHVEFGSLDKFVAGLKDRTTADANDGTSWMLIGLIESQRGQDGNAVDAFRQAETNRPSDALASYYLAQSLLRIGQNEEAVAAFERAIERKPQRNDLLEIFQQLGRVHQRAQRTEEALKVWTRLESLFPDDPRVLEQIAVTLAEEGDNAQALLRYERLAKLVKDDYRRTMCLIEVAELNIKSGRKDAGIGDLEKVMAQLDPDGWIYKDVRRRIDDVFLRAGDQDSLVKYYEKWIAAHPEDVEGMARLAKFLAQSARVPEATQWMEKALKLAPSRTDLRKAFIDQLVDDQRIPEAIRQYEQLAVAAPGNPDFLRDWGKLVLKDRSQDPELRKKEAVRIWSQIVASRPDDAITTAQVADLFRQASLNDEAEALYQKAVSLAPGDPQYREYLGEFYHIQKKTDEALKTWAAIAEGSQRTAENAARLAEVYNSFGYLEQAVKEIAAACALDPKEFVLQMRSAEYHARATKYDEALTFLAAAEKLAASDDDRDALIRQRIEVFQSSQRMDDETKKLAEAVHANVNATPSDWALLARHYEASRQWVDATESVEKGLAIDPKSVPTLTAAARIAETSGSYGQAAEYSRRLADSDRRSRGDHLMNVARLEAQMGRSEQALAAANELIVTAPGNTDNYEFLAQMCFRLGKSDEGLEALRKAVRINPNEPHLIMALAAALADQLRTDEAIEVYWRAFDKSETLDDRTNLTQKLVPLYEQINQLDKLIERFERDRREEEKRREMTICLAQAWQTSGDYGTARLELERLLGENSRDTNLLQQLSKLCETSGDIDAAIGYQRQLIAVAPGHETEFPLVAMLQSRGDRDEAMEILVRLTAREEDPARLLRSIDSLLNQGAWEAVIGITEPLLSQQREDWELLYREGVAWAKLEKRDEAVTRFDRILALTIPHDTLGLFATDMFKRDQAKAKSENLKGNQTQAPKKLSPLQLVNNSNQVQAATGLISEEYYGGNSRQQTWTPREYGVARMASYAWKLKFEEDAKQTNVATATGANPDEHPDAAPATETTSVADQVAAKAQAAGAQRNAVYDWLYFAALRNDQALRFQIARELAQSGGQEEQQFFLNSLQTRHVNSGTSRSRREESAAAKTPLSDDDLELMLRCVADLSNKADKNGEDQTFGQQIAYDGQGNAYIQIGGQWVMIGGGRVGGGKQFTTQVVEELKLAKRDAEADALLKEMYSSAKKAAELSGVISVMLQQETPDQIPDIFRRWIEAARAEIANPEKVTTGTAAARSSQRRNLQVAQVTNALMQWIGHLGPEEEHAQILSILDQTLDIATIESKQRLIAEVAAASKSRRTSAANTGRVQTSMQWIYGKQNQYIQVEWPTNRLDTSTAMLLRDVHEVLKKNDVLPDLVSLLRGRVAKASPEDEPFESAYLATELWWSDEQDEAVEILVKFSESQKSDPNARFELAELRSQRGDIEDALEIVDSIIARDQKLLQRRELMALNLAERLGDHERARTAAERLFGLRLDSTTQLTLVDGMRRLGMTDMADAVIARTERQSSNQPPALASLMMLYQSQGKADRAKQLAHMLLRKTVSPMTTMANATRNPNRYRTNSDSSRTQALTVLQQTGELKTLIGQLESQLERSPESSKLYEQLIEFYGITGQQDKVGPLLEKAIASRPEAFALRLQLAKHWQQTGKTSEACDQYLVLMKQKPDWIFDDFYQIRNLFQTAKRNDDVVAALKTMNLKNISQPYYIIDFVGNLLNDPSSEAIGLELLDKVIEAYPSYRSNLISNIQNPKLWQSERFFELGKKMVIPTEADLKANPWSGLKLRSYSGSGKVSSQFHYLLQGLKNSPRLDDLRKSISETAEKNPGWHAGSAMIALIDLQQGKKVEARTRLQALMVREEVVKSMPYDAGWLIAQELDEFQETRELALSLLEKAMAGDTNRNEFQYTPGARLIKVYIASGRREDARALLIKSMQNNHTNTSQPDYEAYQRANNSLATANYFLEMNYTVDAVKVYQDMLNDEADLKLAGSFNRDENRFLNQAKAGLSKAMAGLDSSRASEAIEQLLTVEPTALNTPSSGASKPALDLLLKVPSSIAPSSVVQESIDSGLVILLVTMAKDDRVRHAIDAGLDSEAKDDKVRRAIDVRLETLQKENPNDLSIAIAVAAFRSQMKDARFAEAVQTLSAIVSDQPLEEIAEGRRPNSRQRKEAALSVPLWIVAREALKDEALRASATALADRALASAKRQTGLQNSAAILLEWSSLLLEAGNKAEAEEKLTELLRIATERPIRKKTDAEKAVGAIRRQTSKVSVGPPMKQLTEWWAGAACQPLVPPYGFLTSILFEQPAVDAVPPLTISQFRLAMTVAETAAKNGMANLSRTAVREAMLGGTPVPDPVATPVANNGRVVRSSRGVPDDSAAKLDAEVVTSLQSVIAKWNGDDYSAMDVYALLKPLVFPASRPADVMLFPDNSKLRNAQAKSLGVSLVAWARKADQISDLKTQIDARKENQSAIIPALVLLIQIDLAIDDEKAAAEHLKALAEAMQKAPDPATFQLACHAALPAADRKDLEADAYAILKSAVQMPWTTPDPNNYNDSGTTTGKLDEQVNRYLVKHGDLDDVRKYFDAQQAAKQVQYGRYGGDYGLYLQWRDLAGFAAEATRNRIPTIALDYLGRAADFDAKQYSPPDLTVPLAGAVGYVMTLEPRQRFETWRDWTMPKEDRQTVRMIAQFVRPADAPDSFLQLDPRPRILQQSNLLCNLTEMLSAAAACGALSELHEAVLKAREDKLPNAEFLYALYLIETENSTDGIPVIQELLDSMPDRYKNENNRQTRAPLGDYVIYQRSLQSPLFADFFAKAGRTTLRMMLESLRTADLIARMDVDFAQALAARTTGQLKPGNVTGLTDWLPTSPSTKFSPSIPAWWAAHENMVYHFAGDGIDVLYFAYPVEGNFEFSVECLQRNWGEGDAGYGGVIFQSQAFGNSGVVISTTGEDSIYRPTGLKRMAPTFNKVQVQSMDGKIRYLLNGHLAYEETLTGTCPWITLAATNARVATFRNPRLSGSPVIPREVRLLTETSMEGWSCSGFGDSRPSPRLMAEKPKRENDRVTREQSRQPTVFDWSVRDGILNGRPESGAAADRQSRIRYCRPLRSGETLRYEFFYEPGTTVAHPSIGRLAMLLEPAGVMTHWLAEPDWDEAISGIPLDNAIAEPECRRGPAGLPLKAADWNSVEISLRERTAMITLNGMVVFERPLPANSDTLVGMFRYQQQEARIRNIVLTGDWPEAFSDELKQNMLLHQTPMSAGDQKMLGELTPEHVFEVQVPELLAHVKTLGPDEAFGVLKDWVLPSESHESIRLAYRCTPIEPGSDARPASPLDLQSPALELVRLAKELNRTGVLLNEVKAFPAVGELARRNRLAMETLLLLQGTDVDLIRGNVKEVVATLEKGLLPLVTPQQRAAEVLVACEAAMHPETRPFAREIAVAAYRMEQDEKFNSKNDRFARIVKGILAPMIPDVPESSEQLMSTQWSGVQYLLPQHRAFGQRASSWRFSRGQAQHLPGARPTNLFFQSPLRGNFEIKAEYSVPPNATKIGSVFVSWGMFSVIPRTDLKAVKIARTLDGVTDLEKPLEIPRWNESAELNISVNGSKITTAANGVTIHEELLQSTPSPWVVLQAVDTGEEAVLRNLRITGTPEIPDQMDLIDMAGWACWRSDVYGERHSADSDDEGIQWKKSGEEIVGQINTSISARPLESLLMYQRPMLEDGEIEFEAFWVPGEQEVHPAVGRSAILVQPDGARLHTMTEAQYETRELPPDNEAPISGAAAKIELRANDWNRIRLVLAGDQLSVLVNGTEVAVHHVTEIPTERFFGLFRYSDRHQCRVRNLVYRANWPKTLPSVAEQELASPPTTQ